MKYSGIFVKKSGYTNDHKTEGTESDQRRIRGGCDAT